uniref:Cadherin domain-containing protein n=1 Tax=Bursaphelenchus xylophilus TaxID=6326 RepID=A0A1I7SFG1_BURXY
MHFNIFSKRDSNLPRHPGQKNFESVFTRPPPFGSCSKGLSERGLFSGAFSGQTLQSIFSKTRAQTEKIVLALTVFEYGESEYTGPIAQLICDLNDFPSEALRIQKYVDYKVEYVQIGLYADVEKIWWLDARLPFNYSNLPPGFIFPKIPTYFAIEVEGRGRKRGEWFALRHDKRGRAFLCGHF